MLGNTEGRELVLLSTIAMTVSIVAWWFAIWAMLVRTRSHDPEPVRAGLEPGSDAPPAIAALLTHRWRALQLGPIATLADLAARRFVTLDRRDRRATTVRLGPATPPDYLTEYERMVLDLVSAQAAEVAIPCADLDLGYGQKANVWRLEFAHATIHDARRRGLSRPRFTGGLTGLVIVLTCIMCGTIGLWVAAWPLRPMASDIQTTLVNVAVTASMMLIVIAAAAGLVILKWTGDERDTPKGLAEAGRWLGMQANLAEDPVFCDQPATAVAVWGRKLAYGIALGVAHGAASDLAFGPRPSREVWTADDSGWHVCHITYPWAFPPGYGRSSRTNLTVSLIQLLAAVGLLGGLVPRLLQRARSFPADHSGYSMGQASRLSLTATAVVLGFIGLVLAARGLAMLVMVWLDRRQRSIVEGPMLRFYTSGYSDSRGVPVQTDLPHNPARWRMGMPPTGWYAAVAAGPSDSIRAWFIPGPPPADVGEGCRVRASVTRNLGTVRDLQVLEPASVEDATQDAQ